MYEGEYHGKTYHQPDLDRVLQRAWDAGVEKIIITAGTLAEARAALALARRDARLFCTAGVHPTRCSEFDEYDGGGEKYMEDLREVCRSSRRSLSPFPLRCTGYPMRQEAVPCRSPPIRPAQQYWPCTSTHLPPQDITARWLCCLP